MDTQLTLSRVLSCFVFSYSELTAYKHCRKMDPNQAAARALVELFLSDASIRTSTRLNRIYSRATGPDVWIPLTYFTAFKCIRALLPPALGPTTPLLDVVSLGVPPLADGTVSTDNGQTQEMTSDDSVSSAKTIQDPASIAATFSFMINALESSKLLCVDADSQSISRRAPYNGANVDVDAHSVRARGLPSSWRFEHARAFFAAKGLPLVNLLKDPVRKCSNNNSNGERHNGDGAWLIFATPEHAIAAVEGQFEASHKDHISSSTDNSNNTSSYNEGPIDDKNKAAMRQLHLISKKQFVAQTQDKRSSAARILGAPKKATAFAGPPCTRSAKRATHAASSAAAAPSCGGSGQSSSATLTASVRVSRQQADHNEDLLGHRSNNSTCTGSALQPVVARASDSASSTDSHSSGCDSAGDSTDSNKRDSSSDKQPVFTKGYLLKVHGVSGSRRVVRNNIARWLDDIPGCCGTTVISYSTGNIFANVALTPDSNAPTAAAVARVFNARPASERCMREQSGEVATAAGTHTRARSDGVKFMPVTPEAETELWATLMRRRARANNRRSAIAARAAHTRNSTSDCDASVMQNGTRGRGDAATSQQWRNEGTSGPSIVTEQNVQLMHLENGNNFAFDANYNTTHPSSSFLRAPEYPAHQQHYTEPTAHHGHYLQHGHAATYANGLPHAFSVQYAQYGPYSQQSVFIPHRGHSDHRFTVQQNQQPHVHYNQHAQLQVHWGVPNYYPAYAHTHEQAHVQAQTQAQTPAQTQAQAQAQAHVQTHTSTN